nr:uncharacterized protein LOC125984881 isoform X2 [Syngnathus scovelli]
MKRRAGGRRPPDPRLVSGLQRKESPKESSRQVLKRSLMHEWPRLARGAGSGWGDLMSACTERDWTGPRDQRWHEAEDESKRRIPAGGGANHRPTFARDERPTRGGRVRMRRGQSAQPAFKERLGVPIGCLTTKKAAAVQSRLLLSIECINIACNFQDLSFQFKAVAKLHGQRRYMYWVVSPSSE